MKVLIITLLILVSEIVQATPPHSCGLDQSLSNCPLVDHSLAPHGRSWLTKYWAQEYVGGDLLREYLEKNNIEADHDLMLNLDIGEHGKIVSSLIFGPTKASLLPGDYHKEVFGAGRKNKGALKEYLRSCSNNEVDCAHYFQNSTSWFGAPKNLITKDEILSHDFTSVSSDAFKNARLHTKSGRVWITTASNYGVNLDRLQDHKSEASKQFGVIVVANLLSNGSPSYSSGFGQSVTIISPAGFKMTAVGPDGTEQTFGGTSGSAPLVTASLIGFSEISGYKPTSTEANYLLKETAIKGHLSRLPNQPYGSGILNAYKIGMVAEKLKQICSDQIGKDYSSCIKENIIKTETYKFPVDETTIALAQNHLPQCNHDILHFKADNSLSCSNRRLLFKKLRQQAFLNAHIPELWQQISCVYQNEGKTRNAHYYKELADSMIDKNYIGPITPAEIFWDQTALNQDQFTRALNENKLLELLRADYAARISNDQRLELKNAYHEVLKRRALTKRELTIMNSMTTYRDLIHPIQ